MSSPNHPTSDIEDAFSFNFPDYTLASPDYFPASPGNTSPDPSNDLTKDILASLTFLPFHDDPYMKRKQIGHDDEIVLSHVRTYTLEMIIEDIQVRHRADKKDLMDAIYELKNCKEGPPNY
nr:hypothetical protein [Tanacetum cinerariifolium]GEX42194.1 hypothetical protein [Tanacetum cinerariifolium]